MDFRELPRYISYFIFLRVKNVCIVYVDRALKFLKLRTNKFSQQASDWIIHRVAVNTTAHPSHCLTMDAINVSPGAYNVTSAVTSSITLVRVQARL